MLACPSVHGDASDIWPDHEGVGYTSNGPQYTPAILWWRVEHAQETPLCVSWTPPWQTEYPLPSYQQEAPDGALAAACIETGPSHD